MLFNEPKLLKMSRESIATPRIFAGFSALQRAEIAENAVRSSGSKKRASFSALQRAEIAEKRTLACPPFDVNRFSALQRAEIAEKALVGDK